MQKRQVPAMQALPGGDNPGGVYICENATGEVIYVGKTIGWRERRLRHQQATPWWGEVERVHLLVHRDGDTYAMRDTERALIGLLAPMHNVYGTTGQRTA